MHIYLAGFSQFDNSLVEAGIFEPGPKEQYGETLQFDSTLFLGVHVQQVAPKNSVAPISKNN
jgi:hypothetical protein